MDTYAVCFKQEVAVYVKQSANLKMALGINDHKLVYEINKHIPKTIPKW